MPGRLLDIREAAEYLNVAEKTLRNKVAAGLVPCTRVFGSVVRFTPEHLAEIVAQGEQQAAPPAPRRRTAHRTRL